jgi:hypothetical protein
MLRPFDTAGLADLVTWAAAYLEGVADMLERAHTDEFGRIRPVETRLELKQLRAWLTRAAILEAAARSPGYVIVDAPTHDLSSALAAHVRASTTPQSQNLTPTRADRVLDIVEAEIAHHSRKPWP